ncbi:hypothetical protein HRbin39_00994 [bacterium HR39]|nr:hypothetical protein HRbin39_00994 [bacterium HR39]
MRWLVRLSDALLRVETAACRLLVVGMVLLLLANALLRHLAGRPLYFAEEAATLMLVWLSFLSVSIALAHDALVRVDLFLDLLPPTARHGLALLWDFAIAAMLLVLLVASVGWIRSPFLDFERVITLDVPKRPVYYVMPLFFASGTLHVIARRLRERIA